MPIESDDLLTRRDRVLAPIYRLFYDEPIRMSRADGVWMYDDHGRRYLDAYNNVPVVGHCNPEVAERIYRQARTLNTHTRYVTEGPVALAERILASMPSALTSAVFTCTGSEANDLAVRIAKAATGGTGFIVTQCAYHGTTETLAGMSPATGQSLGEDVYVTEIAPRTSDPDLFASFVLAALDRMRDDGVRLAGLLIDTIFGSDGVISDPIGFLQPAVQAIHAAGGLVIADEVQPGFARTGDAMWGFERHRIVPDIVTMGKPMGNGHPIAALVAQSAAMDGYARDHRYFNTFGGNTVSCAAALAVLEIIERENLQENARLEGEYLKRRITAIAADDSRIRDVRGAGLFLGVELASGELARNVVNRMRRDGILIGSAGRDHAVLKIRPPLVIQRPEVELIADGLANALSKD